MGPIVGEREEHPKRTVEARIPYWYCIWLVLMITIFGILIRTFISPTNVVMFYLIGVVVAAISCTAIGNFIGRPQLLRRH